MGEKAEQIAMMFTIFRKARKVLAWLGHFLDVPVAKLCLAVAARVIRRITPSQEMIAAAANVVEHQWFSRCRIRQEVAAAQELHLHISYHALPFRALGEFVENLKSPNTTTLSILLKDSGTQSFLAGSLGA